MHEPFGSPSAWVARYQPRIRRGGLVLDLACGRGRHARFLLGCGLRVVAVDIDTSGVAQLSEHSDLEIIEADLESEAWPLGARRFDGIVGVNYLHRPILSRLPEMLADQGILLYDTFAEGNEAFGRPRSPDHLLRRGELLELCRACDGLEVIAYEHGRVDEPKPAVRQSLCAIRKGS